MEATLRHYKGEIDKIYLYCNKGLTLTASSYVDIKKRLIENEIEIIPVTNQEILNQIISNDYSIIADYCFGNKSLDSSWFRQSTQEFRA